MVHPWMRIPDIANMLGLMLGSLAIFITGNQLNNNYVQIIGFLSGLFFLILFVIFLTLFVQDYIDLYPTFTRGFWKIRY